jgi:hypothetical protein
MHGLVAHAALAHIIIVVSCLLRHGHPYNCSSFGFAPLFHPYSSSFPMWVSLGPINQSIKLNQSIIHRQLFRFSSIPPHIIIIKPTICCIICFFAFGAIMYCSALPVSSVLRQSYNHRHYRHIPNAMPFFIVLSHCHRSSPCS